MFVAILLPFYFYEATSERERKLRKTNKIHQISKQISQLGEKQRVLRTEAAKKVPEQELFSKTRE